MAERLRELLERPLDPRVAKAIVVLACAVSSGFAILVLLAGTEEPAQIPIGGRTVSAPSRPASTEPLAEQPARSRPRAPGSGATHPVQDSQDRRGSAAAHRAEREIADHRALQHVPYRHGGVAIALVGARGERALLRVIAPTLAAARQGWRRFLSRYRDSGKAYVPTFRSDRRRDQRRRGGRA